MYDVIIIGSGPAGYTAAIYTSRALLKTLVLSGVQQGGQLTTTTEVENFPGFPKGILGPTLMADMGEQATRFGGELVMETVQSIKKTDHETYIVQADHSYESKAVIIATGASAMYLGLPGETRLKGKGVSACATCDGFFFRGKSVVVLGGGDTAMEEANFLTTFATRVTIVHRRNEFRASPIMVERAKKNPKIAFALNKTVEDIVGEQSVTGVRVKDNETGITEVLPADGVFLAIGHKPSTEFLKGFVEMDEKGYVITSEKGKVKTEKSEAQTVTSVAGVFAAGDCVDSRYRQGIVAAGQGAMAALDAQKYLEKIGI